MQRDDQISRRTTLETMGTLGALALLGPNQARAAPKRPSRPDIPANLSDTRKVIFEKVFQTPFIDTHEHLFDESERLKDKDIKDSRISCDDWAMLFSGYLASDMMTSGMPQAVHQRLFSPQVDPMDKWSLLEPYWPAIKNTGYGQAVRLAIKAIYDIDDISAQTIKSLQAGYEKVRRPGFYKHILCDLGKIESCQVNSPYRPHRPFHESDMPTLLMQDIGMVEMHVRGPNFKDVGGPTGISVASLSDWHRVIDWWFDKYSRYAVAVKSQHAYSRDIDHPRVPAEQVEDTFRRVLNKKKCTPDERKALEDHLFWHAVDKATRCRLPIKLHTGYYAGQNTMPLARLMNNPGSATELCRLAPETTFVFMHICYPYYEEMIAAAKHYTNAHIDMCWSWIINPVAAKDFLKKYLVTAPANKIFTFGGDDILVETALGHAIVARRGIALALSELVEEQWLTMDDALNLIDPIMHENARHIFHLDEKTKVLQNVPWA